MLGGKSVNTETETEPIGGGNYRTDANPNHKYLNRYCVFLFELLIILTYLQNQVIDITCLIAAKCLV